MMKKSILIIALLLISVLNVSANSQNESRDLPYLSIRSLDMGFE